MTVILTERLQLQPKMTGLSLMALIKSERENQ